MLFAYLLKFVFFVMSLFVVLLDVELLLLVLVYVELPAGSLRPVVAVLA